MRLLTGDQDQFLQLDEIQADPYSHLNMPQQRYAEAATRALVDIYQIAETDVRLVVENSRDTTRRFVLVDGSPNGRYYGNFGKILNLRSEDPDAFHVDIEGNLIDVLGNTTYGIYWHMVCEAIHRGNIAPDSVALSHQNELPWTATMLTGEPLTDDGLILVASVSSGAVSNVGFQPNRGGTSMRVRPSIVIPGYEAV
jgi:hypothetical protein